MAALWLIPLVALIGVGGFFLVRAVLRLNAAMAEMRQGLSSMAEMGPRLQRLAGDMTSLRESMEQRRPQ